MTYPLKKTTFIFSLLSFFYNLALAQESAFVINGTLKNFKPTPDKVFLIYPPYAGGKVDSSSVVGGKYKFTGKIGDDALPLSLAFGPEPFLAAPTADIQTTLIVTKGQTEIVSDGEIYNFTENGASQKAFTEYHNVASKAFNAGLELIANMKTIAYRGRQSVRNLAMEQYTDALKDYPEMLYRFILKDPGSEIVPLVTKLFLNTTDVTKSKADSLIAILSQKQTGTTIRAETLTKLKEKSDLLAKQMGTAVGKMAPDFTQNDVNDKPVSLTSYKGRYVLLDFWASWCAPCRAENPNLVRAYAKYHNKNFDVLGVSLDRSNAKQAWLNAIKNDGLTWTQVSDLKFWDNDVAKLYSVNAIPQNFLIDPNGKIIARNLRGEELNKKLAELLGN